MRQAVANYMHQPWKLDGFWAVEDLIIQHDNIAASSHCAIAASSRNSTVG